VVDPRVTDFLVRRAAPADLDRLVEIELAAFETDQMSRRALAAAIVSPAACLLVAEDASHIAGYALGNFRRTSQKGRLFSLARAPEARRGCGRVLLAGVEAEARLRGCTALRLEVRDGNARAIDIYQQAGYRLIGRYEDYYEDGAPALRFEKALDDEAAAFKTPVPAPAPQGRKPRHRAKAR
jgi:ribosomal protein S18 acetylase RimI-like enzyme